jgi:hypothetical protein
MAALLYSVNAPAMISVSASGIERRQFNFHQTDQSNDNPLLADGNNDCRIVIDDWIRWLLAASAQAKPAGARRQKPASSSAPTSKTTIVSHPASRYMVRSSGDRS